MLRYGTTCKGIRLFRISTAYLDAIPESLMGALIRESIKRNIKQVIKVAATACGIRSK
jgi:hypothetical protein